mgnify:CR=1 FL=1
MTYDQAQAVFQNAKLQHGTAEQQPKLIWACCLGVYGADSPCRIGMCGLPEELKESHGNASDSIALVEEHFKKSPVAHAKISKFLETYRKTQKIQGTTTNSIPKTNNTMNSSTTVSYMRK